MKDGEEVTGFHLIHKVCHDEHPNPPMADSYIITGEPNWKVTVEDLIPGEGPGDHQEQYEWQRTISYKWDFMTSVCRHLFAKILSRTSSW